MNYKTLLVDDHAIVLDGLQSLLSEDQDFEVIAKVNSGNFALAHIRSTSLSLMITDYSMPDMNGLELVRQAKSMAPDLKIIVLSMHEDGQVVQDLLLAGIDGYVLKKYTHQELLQAVRVVKQGGQYWSPEINKILIRGISKAEEGPNLTDREIEVLKLLMQELTSKEIAGKLFISERTVETHRKNLLRKTNSSGTVGLVKYAYANKLV
ncbi:MAG: response regulator transcription factor [Sphingobacteriaceae bacterium]|nr:response regulator transcription factor [Sphingobacteriaceae bacterium]